MLPALLHATAWSRWPSRPGTGREDSWRLGVLSSSLLWLNWVCRCPNDSAVESRAEDRSLLVTKFVANEANHARGSAIIFTGHSLAP